MRSAPPSASLLLAAHRIKVKRALFNEIAKNSEEFGDMADHLGIPLGALFGLAVKLLRRHIAEKGREKRMPDAIPLRGQREGPTHNGRMGPALKSQNIALGLRR